MKTFTAGELVRYAIGLRRNGDEVLTLAYRFVRYLGNARAKAIVTRTPVHTLYEGDGSDYEVVNAARLR